MPLRKTSIVIWTAVALTLIPIAIWLLLAIASKNAPSVPPDRIERTDVVAPTQGNPAEQPTAPFKFR